MPWCSRCGKEFEEGVAICSKCQAEVVDHPKKIKNTTFVKLDSVNQQEGEILESLLRSHDIIVLKNYRGAGGYVYMGRSTYGVDLFVPKDQLEKAQEIIEAVPDNEEECSFS